MKTKDVKNCVAQQLYRMQNLPEPQWRAELAELRRGVGRQPGELPALWGSFLAEMSEELRGTDGPSKAEWAIYLALTLYALHQQGANRAEGSMNQPGKTLGRCGAPIGGNNRRRTGLDREQRASALQCVGNGRLHAGNLPSSARDDPAAAAGEDSAGLPAAGSGPVSAAVCGECPERPLTVGT